MKSLADVADLNAVLDGKTVVADPLSPPVSKPSATSVHIGHFATRKPQPRPAKVLPDTWTDSEAKQRVIDGFNTTLMRIGSLPAEQRDAEYASLFQGASPTAILNRTGRGPVNDVGGFREMLGQLHEMRGPVRLACNNTKRLIFFGVPRGWEAFCGEAVDSEVIKVTLGRDRSMAAAAARNRGEKPPTDSKATEYTLETAPPLLRTLLNNVRVTGVFSSFENAENGPKQVWKFTLSCPKFDQPPAQSLCFVLSEATGELLTWQPGRYTQDLPGHLRAARVTVGGGASDDTE